MKWERRLHVFLKERGQIKPVLLEVSPPVVEEKDVCSYCILNAPELFRRELKIYGVDEAQARKLSLELVRHYLGEKALLDDEGKLVVEELL
jgi:hypothetical protein